MNGDFQTVQIIWWATLALALFLTLVATKELLRVIHLCGEIVVLARCTVPAAEGIARHTSAIANVGLVLKLAPTLLETAGALDKTAGEIATTLGAVAPKEG